MKNVHGWLKVILCSAALAFLASCALLTDPLYIPNDNTVVNLSVKEARHTFATRDRRNVCRYVFVDGSSYSITGVRITPAKLIVSNTSGKDRIFKLGELGQLKQIINFGIPDRYSVISSNEKIFTDCYIINALYVLQRSAIQARKENEIYDYNFAASLADYRNKATSNTPLPEEANKYKIQAEGAVRDKQFDDAVDFYAEALKIAPWWPAGHFNRALVLGETGDYEMAMREMKNYLLLAPDAPNARAAQNKIYDWERLESK